MANEISLFDRKKIERLAKKASEKGIERATAYLWKVVTNSIKKGTTKRKEYDLKIFQGQRTGENDFEQVSKAKKYLSSPKRNGENASIQTTSVQHEGLVRRQGLPSPKGSYWKKSASKPGKPPKTHQTDTHGWFDYWLKKSIGFDPQAGVVYLNPAGEKKKGKVKTYIPRMLEETGMSGTMNVSYLEGLYAYKTRLPDGTVNVTYIPIWHQEKKNYRIKPRPFLKPALARAAQYLIKILENSIGK